MESDGAFTLDLQKLHHKLQAFQMEAAHHFVLPFISSGVLGGATLVELSGTFESSQIEFDGETFSLDDLKDAPNQKKGRLGELGVGISFAVSAGATQVQVVSAQGQDLNILQIAKNRSALYQRQNPHPEFTGRTRITISGVEIPPETPPPYKFLCARCGFSPVVAWLGKRVHSPRNQETCGSIRYLCGKGEDPSISLMSWVSLQSEHQSLTGQIWMENKERSEIRFLLNGVAYPTAIPFSRYSGLQGVLSYPMGGLDLSRSSVVVDKSLDLILSEIEEDVERLLLPRLVRNFRGMLPFHRNIAKRFLKAWGDRCPEHLREKRDVCLAL